MSDREAIQELLSRYSLVINEREWTALATLFTPQAHWEVVGTAMNFDGPAIGPGIRGLVEPTDFLAQMNSPAIIRAQGSRATARSTLHEIADIKCENKHVEVYGTYVDELVKAGEEWLFASRRFQILNFRATPLGAS